MNIPGMLALASMVGSLLITVFAWWLAAAPNWRGLRWFAGVSFGGALFASYALLIYSGSGSDAAMVWTGRLCAASAGLFCLCWPPFGARLERRRPAQCERILMGVGVVILALAPIPGAMVTDVVALHSPDGGVTWYREASPTLAGAVSFGIFILVATGYALRGLVLKAVRNEGQWGTGLGLGVLGVGGINDALILTGLHHGPYLLVSTFLMVVLLITRSVAVRMVADARALERLTEDLERTQATLVHRERLAAIGEVSAVVAHEVRNPVAVICNVVSQLRRDLPADHASRQLVEMAAEESERIEQLVTELLDFTSPRTPRCVTQDAVEVVRGAARAALQETRLGEGHLAFDLPHAPVMTAIDAPLLHRAVVNLVTNALQAAGRRAPVQLVLRGEGALLTLEIRDDGDGVPEALAARIFEPFFTTRATGTGLGLSLARQAAEAHGGRLTLEDAPARGACFRWSMPLGGIEEGARRIPTPLPRASA